ncbi:DUF1194 domain-containing protein [Lentibacter algarum]|uniref:DUF1194 domain-containing protein n=1 Tax=Lentibacter algarum TaxID=576131 RepID=UPI001C091CAE|nr:DUF1194 domain-containing protein [Lentibacter algarum]MBU2983221.1 DUF1194 domain-containing protein [Lentibacter algarum]
MALLLAVDVSTSIDQVEYALQTTGLAAALLAPDVVHAFLAFPDQPVALAVFEWSGRYNQVTVQDWVVVTTPAQLVSVADTVSKHQRSNNDSPTAMGHALGHASTLLQLAPRCVEQTIDISGDGSNNEGFTPTQAYGAFPFQAVTVNGLAIEVAAIEAEAELIEYYRNEVLHGAGAFLEVAQGFEDFERAMARKLQRELAPSNLSKAPEPAAPHNQKPLKIASKYSESDQPSSALPVSAHW